MQKKENKMTDIVVKDLKEIQEKYPQFVERYRLWTTPEISKYLAEICARVMGKEWWNKHALPVVISEEDDVNAFYGKPYESHLDDEYIDWNEREKKRKEEEEKEKREGKPRIIVITRGAIQKAMQSIGDKKEAPNEAMIAMILAHEIGHNLQEIERGEHTNTNAEEIGADFHAIQACCETGHYDPMDIYHSFQLLLSDKKMKYDLEKVLDVHGDPNQRLQLVSTLITVELNKMIERNVKSRKNNIHKCLTQPTGYESWVETEIKKRGIEQLQLPDKWLAYGTLISDVVKLGEKKGFQYNLARCCAKMAESFKKEYATLSKRQKIHLWETKEHPFLLCIEPTLKELLAGNSSDYDLKQLRDTFMGISRAFDHPEPPTPISIKKGRPVWRQLREYTIHFLKECETGHAPDDKTRDVIQKILPCVAPGFYTRKHCQIRWDNKALNLRRIFTTFTDFPFVKLKKGMWVHPDLWPFDICTGIDPDMKNPSVCGKNRDFNRILFGIRNYHTAYKFYVPPTDSDNEAKKKIKKLMQIAGLSEKENGYFIKELWPNYRTYFKWLKVAAARIYHKEKAEEMTTYYDRLMTPAIEEAQKEHCDLLDVLLKRKRNVHRLSKKADEPTRGKPLIVFDAKSKTPWGTFSMKRIINQMAGKAKIFWSSREQLDQINDQLAQEISEYFVSHLNNNLPIQYQIRSDHVKEHTNPVNAIFTIPETKRILQSIIEKVPSKKSLIIPDKLYKNEYDQISDHCFSNSFLNMNRGFIIELIYAKEKKQLSQYHEEISEYISDCLGLPPLSQENVDQYIQLLDSLPDKEKMSYKERKKRFLSDEEASKPTEEDEQKEYRKGTLSRYLTIVLQNQAINHPDHVPLKLFSKLKFGYGRDDYAGIHYALVTGWHPAVYNKQNYPQSVLEYSQTAHSLIKFFLNGELRWLPHSVNPDRFKRFAFDLFLERLETSDNLEENALGWATLSARMLHCRLISEKEYNRVSEKCLKQERLWNEAPLDQVVKIYIASKDSFATNLTTKKNVLNKIYERLEKESPKIREPLLFEVLKNIDDPELRLQFEQKWADTVFECLDKKVDDNSEEYAKKVQPYIDKIKEKKKVEDTDDDDEYRDEYHLDKGEPTALDEMEVPYVQQISLGRLLANKLETQRSLSMALKPEEINATNLSMDNLVAISGGLKLLPMLAEDIKKDPRRAADIINFLNGSGSMEECEKFSDKTYSWAARKLRRTKNIENPWVMAFKKRFDKQIKHLFSTLRGRLNVGSMRTLYMNYQAMPQEVQAIIMNAILGARAPEGMETKKIWEHNFDFVMDKIFPQKSEDVQLLKEFMRSYLGAREEVERGVYLAGFLVAAGKKGQGTDHYSEQKNIAKGVRAFLESMGPPGIKLGQALSVHSIVPEYIQEELAKMTSHAAEPARWEIYEWLDKYIEEHPEEKEELNVRLGRILGSASYFVTLKCSKEGTKNSEKQENVIKILREGAYGTSHHILGKILQNVLDDMAEKGLLNNNVATLGAILKQADEAVDVETDMDVGHKQLEIAKDIYPSGFDIDGSHYGIYIADWTAKGKNWAKMEEVKGVPFTQISDPVVKKQVELGYFSLELLNILSGGPSDHDRHPGQQLYDPERKVIGIFDTGAMALEPPKQEDQELLGRVLFKTLNNLGEHKRRDETVDFGAALTEEVGHVQETLSQKNVFLTEVQRGLLALSNYTKNLTVEDFGKCFEMTFNNPDRPVSQHIINGFTAEALDTIGLLENAQNSGWPAKDRENLGRFTFNLIAAAKSGPQKGLVEMLADESKKFPNTPLSVIESLNHHKSVSIGEIPDSLLEHVLEYVKDKKLDPIFIKGIMKEAFDSVNIQGMENRGTPKEKEALGLLLYNSFFVGNDKKKQMERFKEGLQKMSPNSDIARNMLTVVQIAEESPESSDKLNQLITELKSGGNLNPDIARGVKRGIMESEDKTLTEKLKMVMLIREATQGSVISRIRSIFSLFKKREPSKLQSFLEEKGQSFVNNYLNQMHQKTLKHRLEKSKEKPSHPIKARIHYSKGKKTQ